MLGLTKRHSLYACLAFLGGGIATALATILSIIAISIIFGGTLSFIGGFSILFRNMYDKQETTYKLITLAAIATMIGATICFIIAVIGLTMHQGGTL